ncbi:IQ and ubiquitin-like domain-containing protein isoform X2 [Rhineura floridana]|uniref:IQ and ubiquitin-like domain-containing protein isoform X2 n=1 Tax=Rhineura floridana TaxID=261503 RepID=UPI002AC83BDB|nr:IQ and ubiquitin-like domain-containing protein isoform X2 [Rhineura floridana]
MRRKMADPEKEASDLAEAETEKQVVEDTSGKQAEVGLDSIGTLQEQTDAIQLDETNLPTEQEQGPELATGELGDAEEPLQELTTTEELAVAEELVQELARGEELITAEELAQGQSVVEEPTQSLPTAEEPGPADDWVAGLAAAEGLTQGLEAIEKEEELHPDSQDVVPEFQTAIPDIHDLGAGTEPPVVDTGAPDISASNTAKGVSEKVDFATDTHAAEAMLTEALAAQRAEFPENTREATVTVQFMLHPDIQIFTKAFNINQTVEHMKQYFATRLKIPLNVLQIMLLGIWRCLSMRLLYETALWTTHTTGNTTCFWSAVIDDGEMFNGGCCVLPGRSRILRRIINNSETLWNLGATPYATIQVDIFSLDEENFPIKASKLLEEFYMPDVITVRVQSDSETFKNVDIAIKRPSFEKPFLGGYRHKQTGTEYHHAGSQTDPKKHPDKGYEEFCRSTQTAVEKKNLRQTRNTTSTQMTKIGVYVSNVTDKLIEPKTYVTAEEYHAHRLKAVIIIQTYFRRWLAKTLVNKLKEELRLRMEWEELEALRKQREKAEKLLKEYNRRLVPRTKDDFELLYHALELWRQEELENINSTLTGAERKAALCGLLEKETELIASIGRHKINADQENAHKAVLSFLEKCAEPKKWKAFDGKITEMDTQFTLRARELLENYRSISMKDLPQDERLDVLLTLKHTVKEHDCKLTHDIVELIDREADLMMRGVKECNLQGLRQRICTLFFQYIKTPLFNPEVAKHLKVPPDPIRLYHNIYFCLGCKRYLPSTDFAISATSHTVGRCRLCCKLDNEARQREAFLKYKRMLRNLRESELNYKDGAKIAFVIQLQDLRYMVENFWGSQSALSAWDDLYDLVMVRWNKYHEWSPWNTLLIKRSEAEAHLNLKNLEKAYEMVFIHKIKHKHILARNYFSQFPELAAALHKDDKQTNTDDLLVTKSLTAGPSN